MADHIYGNHDWSRNLADMIRGAGKSGWQVITVEVGDDPNDQSSQDFSYAVQAGVTPIVRINYSHHGQGTIPLPDRYDEFAVRVYNFVRNSQGCSHWLIGNEPNLHGERPEGVAITPADYVRCFGLVRDKIRLLSNAPHKVYPAAVAPYNVDTGDWIVYFRDMVEGIRRSGGCDGFAVHTYSRGSDPNSIFSEDKMDPPYQAYYNGFRAYRDFLSAIPREMRNLPVFITETDQLEPWADRDSGWVVNAYKEINAWNVTKGTQKISLLALYRWDPYDQWEFQSKNGVVNDLRDAVNNTNYRVLLPDSENTVQPPQGNKSGPVAVVVTPAGANLRSAPGTTYSVLGAAPVGTVLKVVGKNLAADWWQVETEQWGKAWVSSTVVSTEGVKNVPVVKVLVSPSTPIPGSAVNQEWMITAWCRVLGLNETVVRAILAIESNGSAFQNGRMVIRFENHLFGANIEKLAPQLQGVFKDHFRYGSPPWTGHQVLLPGRSDWEKQHDGGQAEEWLVFGYARSLHETAAMLSISMGMGQIIGSNYVTIGYPNVQSMFADFNHLTLGQYNQLTGFFAYVVNRKGMLEAIKAKDWLRIATYYNGMGNEDVYAPILHNKYIELGGKD